MAITRRELIQATAAGGAGIVIGGAGTRILTDGDNGDPAGLGGDVGDLAEERGMDGLQVSQAIRGFTPPGEWDEFIMIASGGHGGQLGVYGIPSMRLLKNIAVFAPEPWQGFGYGSTWSEAVLDEGTNEAQKSHSEARGRLNWADTHHPAISETEGEYDGRWAYINDRANGRIGMVDLRDFKTKQIWDIPNLQSSHGGVFVTPNTEYAHISTKTPTLIDMGNVENCLDSEEEYAASFRGFSTFCAIDHETGLIDIDQSFQVELPPYNQDLADAGKLASDGWVFINSYNTELARGGVMDGEPPLEIGMSQNEFDYCHMINWRRAEEVAANGRTEERNGVPVIPLEVAIEEGIIYLAPEPRSPHGVDVSPDGNYLCIGGKLDPHVTVFGFDLILDAIEAEDFEGHDRYGIPILNFDSIVAGRVEVGAGPLHTQFDQDGYGYISLFIESAVAKFSLGEPWFSGDEAFQLVDKVDVHYNIGHLVTMEGDTVSPQGKYLVALNKWSIDRHPPVGPLFPQNFQLVSLDGEQMELLADMPIGTGEPHYVQCIRADRLQAWEVYPPGVSPTTMDVSEHAIERGEERIERNGNNVEVWGTMHRSTITPDIIRVQQGDHVILHLTNTETTPDAIHAFAIPRYNISISVETGETTGVEFDADIAGAFAYYCTEFCSALHLEMQGWMLVSE